MRALGHERNDTIDVFRALAILSVALYHYSTIDVVSPSVDAGFLRWLELGRFGVHVFFIISGAVIAMTLTRSSGLADFAIKRAARIYPAYLVAMLLTTFCSKVLHMGYWIGKWQFLQNLLPYSFGQSFIDPSYWSLTYELQFYILIGVAFAHWRPRLVGGGGGGDRGRHHRGGCAENGSGACPVDLPTVVPCRHRRVAVGVGPNSDWLAGAGSCDCRLPDNIISV